MIILNKHISLQQKVKISLDDIEKTINKNNVKFILPLLFWVKYKIKLIEKSEAKKQEIKECKKQKRKPPSVLKCSRGEIWEAYLGYNIGSEQNGVNQKYSRPVLIIQNDINNKKSPNTIIAPLSKIENRIDKEKEISQEELKNIKSKLRLTESLLYKDDVKEGEEKLLHPSIVLLQNIREINKERLDYKITHIKDECWEEINNAIKYSLGID